MRIRTMPIALAALVALVTLAACSTGESAVPGIDGSPDLGAAAEREGEQLVVPTTELSATTTTGVADNAPATNPGTSVSEPDSTAISRVDEVCNSLATDGFATRLATMMEANVEYRSVEAACPEVYTQWNGAIEIVTRMARFDIDGMALTATDLVCDGGSFSLSITNNVDHPIGVHASMRLVGDGTGGPAGSTLQPLAIWSVEPGATSVLTDSYRSNSGSDEGLTCEVDIAAFDATPGDADASLGETRVAELAVDNPAAWLPFLIAQGAAIIGTGDADLAAVVEDVRSAEYRSVVELVRDVTAEPASTGTISVCTASIEQPDDRHMSVVYFDDGAESSQLRHGLFRRGNDAQWRWLSSSVYFDSQEYWECGTPSSDL